MIKKIIRWIIAIVSLAAPMMATNVALSVGPEISTSKNLGYKSLDGGVFAELYVQHGAMTFMLDAELKNSSKIGVQNNYGSSGHFMFGLPIAQNTLASVGLYVTKQHTSEWSKTGIAPSVSIVKFQDFGYFGFQYDLPDGTNQSTSAERVQITFNVSRKTAIRIMTERVSFNENSESLHGWRSSGYVLYHPLHK